MADSVFKVNLGYHGPAQTLGRLTAGLRRWRDRNAALRAFERLDDRDLQDIGIDRYSLRALIDARLAERELRERRLEI
ncbi:MAG TPA: DUF1127 domain-containing protein [Dongiaceae bacterium]|nr:DUF1127 domain-containing protein [Dongiaceae bacterium]